MLHYNRTPLKCYITTEEHENVTLQQNNIKMLHYNRTPLKCYIATEEHENIQKTITGKDDTRQVRQLYHYIKTVQEIKDYADKTTTSGPVLEIGYLLLDHINLLTMPTKVGNNSKLFPGDLL